MLTLKRVALYTVALVALVVAPTWSAGAPQPCARSINECPLDGCSGNPSPYAPFDPRLNTQKNRGPNDLPAADIGPFDVDQFRDPNVLPTHTPSCNKDLRSCWSDGDAAAQAVQSTEQHVAALVGYVLHAHAGGAESCNCDIAAPNVVDYHINLVQDANSETDPSRLVAESVIVEITHRMHDPAWTLQALNSMALETQDGRTKPRVRVIGALTYDNVHTDMLSRGQRGTLWEVHPIREIDVEVNGQWVAFTGAHGSQERAQRELDSGANSSCKRPNAERRLLAR